MMKRSEEKFGLRNDLMESIIELAKKNGVEKLYLFGSRARGDYRRTSDIDLAAKGGNITMFHIELEEEAPTLLTFDVVDLSDGIGDALQQELKKDGVLIYEHEKV